MENSHNHPPSDDARAHSVLQVRSLDEPTEEMIEAEFKSGVKAHMIFTHLVQQFKEEGKNCPLVIRDLYNMRAEVNQKDLKGWSPIQALLDELHNDPNVIFAVQKDKDNWISHLVGINNDDDTPKKLHELFMEAWWSVIKSHMREEFDTWRQEFNEQQPSKLVDYCENTWLHPHAKCLVWCFVDTVHHFGHKSSSRVEGSHCDMKLHLFSNATGDLYITYKSLQQFWSNQHQQWDALIASSKIQIPISTRRPIFSELTGVVTTFATLQIASLLQE
ncbi:hypothetical protein FQN50_010044, partial [Emmonsiellopsis sp. PD_5]